MKFLQYITFIFPLLVSCQQYNKQPYDKYEKTLRMFPTSTTEIIFDSLWARRDSLTYLRLENVRNIYLSDTDSIPIWISNFKHLKSIESFSEKIKINNIPEDIGKNGNLTHIELPHNNIINIPQSLYNLKKLERLNLSDNNIEKIGTQIENLKEIKIILLSYNQNLLNIPNEICNLSDLVSLSINNTGISNLPKCLKNMKNLESINISSTNISYLPIEVLNTPKLNEINAKGLKLKNYEEVKAICEKRNITFYYNE
ncbi:leucine-rich repeat domain-containing protein [Chryseobacterium sp. CBSDS_008]|uniref:leucine-rich repeat domain-containing protein n=1 Tax=Chryseobacterium sp. CBSDS_008 TaxID=3415265 RepID=UPI003CF62F77